MRRTQIEVGWNFFSFFPFSLRIHKAGFFFVSGMEQRD